MAYVVMAYIVMALRRSYRDTLLHSGTSVGDVYTALKHGALDHARYARTSRRAPRCSGVPSVVERAMLQRCVYVADTGA